MQYLEVPQPPTLNNQLNAARTNRFKAAGIKKSWTNKIAKLAANLEPFETPIWVAVEATYKTANNDQDNLYSACKFVFDGLQKAGIIQNDNVNHIKTPVLYSFTKHTDKLIKLWMFDNYEEYREFILESV
ncbi:hypothetical protein [Myxosarcina sp. GI1(2024)]